ncbi:MAG: cellulose synthase family protein [Verrucomicrobiota bacterium]
MLGILWYVLYGLVVIGLSIYGAHRMWMVWTFLRVKSRFRQPGQYFDPLPKVTVQLPLYNERFVVKRLLQAVVQLDYPKDLLQVQVLDDSNDDTSEIIADELEALKLHGVHIQHIRRGSREGFKAGALRYGMEQMDSEFIAIFDADFIPPANILRETIHYFTDEKVGLIQTRWGHINRNFNLLTRIQAVLLDGHLIVEQTVRNRTGRFFNFNGTAGIWRKKCIEDAGGWEHDTLTEDLDLSYRAQMAGWNFVFLPGVITPAELPVEMNGFKTQQHRWAKGAVQTCKKLLPRILTSRLPLFIKVEAVFHLTSNFAYLLLALMAFLIVPDPAGHPDLPTLLALHLPVFTLATLSVLMFYALVLREAGIRWTHWIIYLPLLISLGIGLSLNNAKAVLEALFNQTSEFTRTPKYGIGKTRNQRVLKVYFSPRSWLVIVELAMFVHFALYAHAALDLQLWYSLPFFVLFCFGFGYTAFLSLGADRWAAALLGKLKTRDLATDGI